MPHRQHRIGRAVPALAVELARVAYIMKRIDAVVVAGPEAIIDDHPIDIAHTAEADGPVRIVFERGVRAAIPFGYEPGAFASVQERPTSRFPARPADATTAPPSSLARAGGRLERPSPHGASLPGHAPIPAVTGRRSMEHVHSAALPGLVIPAITIYTRAIAVLQGGSDHQRILR